MPPGVSDRPEQLREVVKGAREARNRRLDEPALPAPGTRKHFLEHLAKGWPELLPRYRELGVADRRIRPAEPARETEQLALEV